MKKKKKLNNTHPLTSLSAGKKVQVSAHPLSLLPENQSKILKPILDIFGWSMKRSLIGITSTVTGKPIGGFRLPGRI